MGLDTVELVLLIEARFAHALDDAAARESLESLTTLGELSDFLHARLNPPGAVGPDWQMIYGTLEEILVANFGVARERIHPGARIVADLGLQ